MSLSLLAAEFRIERDDERCIACQVCVRQCANDVHEYDLEDDWGAYIIGSTKVPSKYVPRDGGDTTNEPGWISYDFEINSQSKRLPTDWNLFRVSPGSQAGGWRQLMQDVSYVQFYYGDPTLYYILVTCELGLDNPRITWE